MPSLCEYIAIRRQVYHEKYADSASEHPNPETLWSCLLVACYVVVLVCLSASLYLDDEGPWHSADPTLLPFLFYPLYEITCLHWLQPLQWQLQEQYSSKALLTIDYLRLSLTANVLDCTGLMITVVCFYLPSSTALNQLNRDNNHLCINMAPLDTTVRQASRLAELAVALISHDISSSTVRHHSTSYLMSERCIH